MSSNDATDNEDDLVEEPEVIDVKSEVLVKLYSTSTSNRVSNHHSRHVECPQHDSIEDFIADLMLLTKYEW